MYSLSAICRLSAPVAVCFVVASVAVAETTTVGIVDKVQAQVNATQAGQTRALAINSDVYFRDRFEKLPAQSPTANEHRTGRKLSSRA